MANEIEKQETAKTEEVKTEETSTEPKLSADEIKAIATEAFTNVAREQASKQLDKTTLPTVPPETKSIDETNKKMLKWMSDSKNKGITEGTSSSGSRIAVPVELNQEILHLMQETGVVRRNARKFPMTTMVKTFRVVGTEDEASWAGQSVGRDATSSTFVDVTFTRTNLGKINIISNDTVEDSENIVGTLGELGSSALRKAEDKACFVGNGSTITGLVNESDVNEIELTGTITQGALTYKKMLDLVNAGSHERTGNEKLFMHRNTWSELQSMEDSNGNIVAGTDDVRNPNWKGIPVEFVKDMIDPVTSDGTNKCYILYGDLNNVGFGVRKDEQIGVRYTDNGYVSNVDLFSTRQQAWAFDEDIDIKTLFPKAFSKITSAH
jgi:HK97 family phage major capsid protein